MSTASDWKKVRKEAQEQGWTVRETKSGYQLFPPDRTQKPISIHRTPSDHRALENTITRMRRAGFLWEGR